MAKGDTLWNCGCLSIRWVYFFGFLYFTSNQAVVTPVTISLQLLDSAGAHLHKPAVVSAFLEPVMLSSPASTMFHTSTPGILLLSLIPTSLSSYLLPADNALIPCVVFLFQDWGGLDLSGVQSSLCHVIKSSFQYSTGFVPLGSTSP